MSLLCPCCRTVNLLLLINTVCTYFVIANRFERESYITVENCRQNLSLSFILLIYQLTVEEENQIKAPIIKRFEEEGHPYFSSAR